MDHVAILAKDGHLLQKILAGEKVIESRWSRTRRVPFHAIASGDTIYFKESGCLVTARAIVREVLFFEGLTKEKIFALLRTYHGALGVSMAYYDRVKDTKYLTLVFLERVQEVEPFAIDKKGFGLMAAWLAVGDIAAVRK